jgi:hypothetical protein
MSETDTIEHYILGQLAPADKLLFEAKLMLDEELAGKTRLQQQLHEAVMLSGRKQLRKELAVIDHRMFRDRKYSRFQRKVRAIFLPPSEGD